MEDAWSAGLSTLKAERRVWGSGFDSRTRSEVYIYIYIYLHIIIWMDIPAALLSPCDGLTAKP